LVLYSGGTDWYDVLLATEAREEIFNHDSSDIVYISGSPFVLRDSSGPRETLPLSDRAENIEDIERRLKKDILVESLK
jgi:Inositol hexakisphosphate